MRLDSVGLQAFKGYRLIHVEAADAGAAQRREVSAGTQDFPQIAGDGADIGAAATVDPDLHLGRLVVDQLQLIDADDPRFKLHILTFTGEVVRPTTPDPERAVCRRALLNLAHEFCQFQIQAVERGHHRVGD